MSIIKKTTDYSIFQKHTNNRQIDQNNLKRIIYSITAQNMLQYRPILVDAKMQVIDGQHRLAAAEKLGLAIYYQMNEEADHQDIVLLNNYQKQWSTTDYIEYYASRGNDHYKKLVDFCKKKDVRVREILPLFYDVMTRQANAIREGKFEFPSGEDLEEVNQLLYKLGKVMELIKRYLIDNKKVMGSSMLKQAMFQLLRNPQVQFDTLINKITFKADSIRQCISVVSYYAMFRDIYNWKNQNPVE